MAGISQQNEVVKQLPYIHLGLSSVLSGVRADIVDQCLKIGVVFFHAVYQQIRNALFQSLP